MHMASDDVVIPPSRLKDPAA